MAGASRRARLRSVSAGTPEAIHDELAAAFNSRDVDAFVDLHEEDAVTIPPTTGRSATGRGEIRASIEPVFALRPSLTNRVLRKLERDGLALTFARWRLTGTDPDGRPVEMEGTGTIVSRRHPDGGWRIVMESPTLPDDAPRSTDNRTMPDAPRAQDVTRTDEFSPSSRLQSWQGPDDD
jgi:uncharacterized protein (TIGR02246 family)